MWQDHAGSLQWVEDAGIIRRCYNTEITELPLDGHRIQSEFKVYMADIGLLVSMKKAHNRVSYRAIC
jgi:hypothetical protein